MFLIPKPNVSTRIILNLKSLNEYIETQHFKLEDNRTARDLIHRDCYMSTLDLKDAYYLVPIIESDKKFLRFRFNGDLYEFACLPFGLNTAPYVFTKLMRPVVGHLRQQGFISVICIDDLLLLGDSFSECAENRDATCSLLEKLGFLINKKKSQLNPDRKCKYLGFLFDSEKMLIELTESKRDKVTSLIKKFSNKRCKIRDFASFVGTLSSYCITVKYGKVYLKDLEREKFLALR